MSFTYKDFLENGGNEEMSDSETTLEDKGEEEEQRKFGHSFRTLLATPSPPTHTYHPPTKTHTHTVDELIDLVEESMEKIALFGVV